MQGLFLWEMTVYTAAPPANAGNFPLWPHLKFCFSAWFLAFFALQVVFVFVPLARFWDFRKCFHAHKWAGACFSLYDIGQTGATSRPLSDCAPRSGRDTRTACPRWKPYSAPADGTQHAREHLQASAPASCPTPPTLEAVPASRREIMQGSTSTDTPAAHNQTAHGEPRHQTPADRHTPRPLL